MQQTYVRDVKNITVTFYKYKNIVKICGAKVDQ